MKTNHPVRSMGDGVTVLKVPEGARGDAHGGNGMLHVRTLHRHTPVSKNFLVSLNLAPVFSTVIQIHSQASTCFQDTTALLPLSVLAGSQEEKKHQCQIKAGSKCSEEKKKSELQPAAIVSVCESGAVICVCVRAKHLAPPFHNMPQYMKSLRRSCAYYQHSYP